MADQPKTRSRRLQFSLRTMLLTVLLGGSGVLLWLHWEPWRLERSFAAKTYPEFSPDGRKLAWIPADDKNTIVRMRDLDSGAEWDLVGHTAEVEYADFFPDSSRIRSVSSDKTLRVWDAASGRNLFTLDCPDGATYSPDGQLIFILGKPNLEAFDISDGKLRYTLNDESGKDLRFECDGKFLLSRNERRVRLYDVHSGATLFALANGEQDELSPDLLYEAFLHGDIAVSPDGARLAVIAAQSIRIIAIPSGKIDATVSPDLGRANLYGPQFSFDSRYLLACTTEEGVVHVWDAVTHELRHSLYNTWPGQGTQFLRDGRLLVLATGESRNLVLDLATGAQAPLLQPDEKMRISNGDWAITEIGGDTAIWDLKRVARIGMLKDCVKDCPNGYVLVSPSGRHLVSIDANARGCVWSVETGAVQRFNPPFENYGSQADEGYIDFSKDERYALACNFHGNAMNLYKLRRPESRFGFLYLPEFWLTLAIAAAFVWNLWRGLRAR